MPPSRNQAQDYTLHRAPYSRDRNAAAMTSTSRHSSSGSGVANKSPSQSQDQVPKLGQVLEDSTRPRPDQETDHDVRREPRKKKRRTKNRSTEDETIGILRPDEDAKPLKLQNHTRPLATSTGNNNALAHFIKASATGATSASTPPKPSSVAPAKSESRLQKLEQRTERYKAKFKEAEARAAKDQERAQKAEERSNQLEARLKEQETSLQAKEEEAKGVQQVVDDHLKAIEGHIADKDHVKETLREAVSCLICSDILRDPHILSCGHLACRDCLKSWFRQPNAYQSHVDSPISPARDLSYRSKVCHVCRSIVLRRPTRMYNLYPFLEPLGIISGQQIPTASQPPASANADPWALTFPPDKTSYRLHDEADDIDRCPSCLFEISDNVCNHCDAEFSGDDAESYGGTIFGMDSISDERHEEETDDEEGGPDAVGEGAGGGRVRARRVGGPRRARVDIATVQEVLGEGEGDEETYQDATNHTVPVRPRGPPAIDVESDSEFGDDSESHRETRARALIRGLHRAGLLDEEAIDEDETLSGLESDLSDLDSPGGNRMFDSDEDDGGLPRTRTFAGGRARPIAIDEYDEDEALTEDESYEGSFIDDEGDGLSASTQEDDMDEGGDESDEVLAEATIGSARREETDEEEQGDEEQDEQEEAPVNMQELRRRRLEALANSRRNGGSRGSRRIPVDSDIEVDALGTDSDA